MLVKQYVHRLPANYDIELIRSRASQRGVAWDSTEGLVFKAFVVQERGKHEAPGNAYSSVYLWSDARAAARFLMGSGFQGVIDMFGRPQVETWLPLDARRGIASEKLFLYREDTQLQGGRERELELQAEVEQNEALAAKSSTYLAVAALDALHWRLARFVVTSEAPESRPSRSVYEVLYFAQPGIQTLAR